MCVCASKRYLTWCVVVCRRTSYGTVSLQSLFSGRADLGFTRVAFSLFLWNRDFLWFSYLVFCNLSNQSLGTVVGILLELFNEEHHFFCLGGWRTSRTSQVYWFYTIDIYRLCKSPTANRKSWEIIEPLSKTLWKPQRPMALKIPSVLSAQSGKWRFNSMRRDFWDQGSYLFLTRVERNTNVAPNGLMRENCQKQCTNCTTRPRKKHNVYRLYRYMMIYMII